MKKERKSLENLIRDVGSKDGMPLSTATAIASAVREWHREEMNKALGSCM